MRSNLFIVGAPKSGTTSTARWLAEHPDCFLPKKKEPHYFSDFLRNGMTRAEYESLYEGCTKRYAIDGSTSYLHDPSVLRRILSYNPTARFVVQLRDPTELVQALHGECLYRGSENEADFSIAWTLQERRRRGEAIPSACENPSMLLYRDQAQLGRSLSTLIELAGRPAVHWIFLEDLATDPQREYKALLSFLQLPHDGRESFPVFNSSRSNRYPRLNRFTRRLGRVRADIGIPGLGIRRRLQDFASEPTSRSPIAPQLRSALAHEFQDDIRLLSSITTRDLSHWTKPAYAYNLQTDRAPS